MRNRFLIKRKYPHFFLLISTALCIFQPAISLYGQTSELKIENIKFLPIEGRLSEGTVTSIVQDYRGVMWFGTRFGLNRYNGIDFSVYEHEYDDSTSLSNSYINYLLEDSNQSLWVGTANGLNLYNRNGDSFKRFLADPKNKKSLSHSAVYTIFEDSKKNIWVGTEKGLNKYNPEDQSFTKFFHDPEDPNSLSHNYIRAIFEDSRGNICVGTYGGGLNKYNAESNQFTSYSHSVSDSTSLSSNHIRVAFKDKNGAVWIGTKGGLNLLIENDGDFKFKQFKHEIGNPNSLSHHIVSAIGEDEMGDLWVGTENGGLSIYNKDRKKFFNYAHDPLNPTSLMHNSIWSIYRDNVGTMWLGLLNKGVNKWDKFQSKFKQYNINSSGNGLSNSNVTSFAEDDAGNLWIGTDGGGLNYFNRSTNNFDHYFHDPVDKSSLGSNAVTALLVDSEDDLWVGAWEGGLSFFDKSKGSFINYKHDPLDPNSISSNNIFSIIEDRKGRLWIAAFEGGLDMFDKKTQSFTHYYHNPFDSSSLCHNKVFELFEDSKGNIWIGTEGGGLSVMHFDNNGKASFTHYKHNPEDPTSLGGDAIINIIEDRDNNIWIGTFGGGLSCFFPDKKQFKTYRKEDGLPNNVVHAILEDDKENLWISTNDGIARFNIKNETFRVYSQADGLQAQEFTRGAALETKKGEFFFGGVNGFNTFFPDEIYHNPHIPPVYITDFRIYGKQVKPGDPDSPLTRHISDTEKIILNDDQNVFSFEVSALNYTQASENQYAYKLEGFDKNWQYIGTRRNIYYTKVPQGTYTFRVKGSNNDNKWNEIGSSIQITILPPWYATWWAYSLYVIVGLALLYLYQRNLIYRERLKSDLKMEHLEVTKMQEVDQMKTNFFANISHEFRTPLTLILGPLKAMQAGRFEGDLKGQLKMMIRNGDRLLRLINQLLDLSKLEEGKMKLKASEIDIISFSEPIVENFIILGKSKKIKLNFNAPENGIRVFFDPDKFEKILFNLLSNAIKFTNEGGVINISFTIQDRIIDPGHNGRQNQQFINLRISDNGIGIKSEELSSIFNRFYQANNAIKGDMKGTGIGLSLTRELVELHRGTISVQSEEGAGTEFCVSLPLGSKHLSVDEIISNPSATSLSDKNLDDFNGLSVSQPPEEKKSCRVKPRANLAEVLIIEDNEDLRNYICNQLREHYNILEAKNGIEGLEKAQKRIPDLIISDVMMPEMDGYELCKKLKEGENTSHIPIILLTAKVSSENQKEGIMTGADYYMTKPFDAEILLLRVKNIIGSREKLESHIENNTILLAPKKVNLESSDEKFLKQALSCIEENMSNTEFGVEAFGDAMGISRMQLYRKLKELTGYSANEFIKSMRLKRASQLLEMGELNISEITYEVGFNDLKHFRACFKKEFGVNPSQFSKKHTS